MIANNIIPAYDVHLLEKNGQHFYRINNDPTLLGGVTSFLQVISKPALIGWAKKEALLSVEQALKKRLKGTPKKRLTINADWITEIIAEGKKKPAKLKDDAAGYGKKAHAFIDGIIKSLPESPVPEDIKTSVLAFKKWWESSGIEIIMGDTKVASRDHEYGGSLDWVGKRNGKIVIGDFKTSSGIWPEFALQIAAYANALYETYGIIASDGLIVRFGKKEPDWEVRWVANLTHSFDGFLAAKKLAQNLRREQYEINNENTNKENKND